MNCPPSPRRPYRLARRPGLESLERRELLASNLSASILPSAPVPAELGKGGSGSQPYDALIGASAVRSLYQIDGTGLTAAVIDTGVNYRHEALGGSFGPTSKVVAGVDFGDNDADPDASTWQHGTAVAGLIASSNPSALGVAPGADIAALRVFGSDNRGTYDRIASALRWVLDNAPQYSISVVNLSLSDGGNYSVNPFLFTGGVTGELTNLVRELRLKNIPVVSAAGNSFKGQQGMGFTAILPESISVTASDSSDRLLPDAQRLGSATGGKFATDLAAPGANLVAPQDGQSLLSVSGTSFAAPIVSGAIILLQSIYQQRFGTLPSVDLLESWLRQGAETIQDSATGITLPRLNVAKAAALIPGNPTPPPTPPLTPAEPVTPPPPPPVTPVPTEPAPIEDALTSLYKEGQPVATVPSADPRNPLAGFFTAFGLKGQFNTVHTWSAARSVVPTEPATTGSALRQRATDSRTSSPAAVQSVSTSQQDRQRKRTVPSRFAAQKTLTPASSNWGDRLRRLFDSLSGR